MQIKDINGQPVDKEYLSTITRLVKECNQATELFSEDDLEAFANQNKPHIGFWYGETFLGEVIYESGGSEFVRVQNAKQKLASLYLASDSNFRKPLLYSAECTYKIYY